MVYGTLFESNLVIFYFVLIKFINDDIKVTTPMRATWYDTYIR